MLNNAINNSNLLNPCRFSRFAVLMRCRGGFSDGSGQDFGLFPSSAPAEGHVSGPVASLFDQGLVELAAGPRVDGGPAELAVVLKTGDVSAEERRELPPAAAALALVAHLVVQDIWLHLHPLVDVVVLQLDESSADGGDVALLV